MDVSLQTTAAAVASVRTSDRMSIPLVSHGSLLGDVMPCRQRSTQFPSKAHLSRRYAQYRQLAASFTLLFFCCSNAILAVLRSPIVSQCHSQSTRICVSPRLFSLVAGLRRCRQQQRMLFGTRALQQTSYLVLEVSSLFPFVDIQMLPIVCFLLTSSSV